MSQQGRRAIVAGDERGTKEFYNQGMNDEFETTGSVFV